MVGIIFINDLNVCPYIDKYIETLNEQNQEYEIIIWDRSYFEGKKQRFPCKHIYKKNAKESDSAPVKLKDFYFYFRYVKKVLKAQKYDKLIILSSLTGIFLNSVLRKKYRDRYIFDYRDASYEFFGFYRKLLNQVIENSFFTCISSKGFREILPPNDYFMAHNFRPVSLKSKLDICRIRNEAPFKVGYIGNLRNSAYVKQLIGLFKDDKRFTFILSGGGDNFEELKSYCAGMDNIVMTGRYEEDEKAAIVQNVDLLCYNYPSSYINDYALANKYYDSLIYKKPCIGNSETYSGRLIQQNGLGISIGLDCENFSDHVYDYCMKFDRDAFKANADRELAKVLEDDKIYIEKIREFINSEVKA